MPSNDKDFEEFMSYMLTHTEEKDPFDDIASCKCEKPTQATRPKAGYVLLGVAAIVAPIVWLVTVSSTLATAITTIFVFCLIATFLKSF